jgi:hypothetical protein
MTSPDGITWTSRTAAAANNWKAVCFGNGVFVAISTNGTDRVMTSPDGITWTSRTNATEMYAVCYGYGLYVATGFGTLRVSTDGITWAAVTSPISGSRTIQAVGFGNGIFVATAGFTGTASTRVMSSGFSFT